jgi:hypothetical protein
MLAGVALEEAHEYAVALGLLLAGSLSLCFLSAYHWKGIEGFIKSTKAARALEAVS